MPKNDNAHAVRLIEALRSVHGDDSADSFADSYPLSKSADADKKYQWACDICHALQFRYSNEEALQIRRACRCGDGKTMAQEIKNCITKAGDLAAGCALFSQKNKYAFLEYIDEHGMIFGYHACVCSCIKRVPDSVSMLWCECSAGHAEAMFRQIFGETVEVTLLSSTKSGAEQCRFRVHW